MSQLPSTPPSQGNVQPLPDFARVPHCSEWEDRDIMRGLGINSPHHVSHTLSIKDKASWALARFFPKSGAHKSGASKAMSGVHTRFREDGGDDDASDSSIEDFSAYGNSLCASPSSFC